MEGRFKCCRNKVLSNFCCITCNEVFHPSCLERKPNVVRMGGHKIYCSSECQSMYIEDEEQKKTLEDQINELRKENKNKLDYIRRLKRGTEDFERVVEEDEKRYLLSLKNQKEEIVQLNKEMITLRNENRNLAAKAEECNLYIAKIKKEYDELNQISREMHVSIATLEKDNDFFIKEAQKLRPKAKEDKEVQCCLKDYIGTKMDTSTQYNQLHHTPSDFLDTMPAVDIISNVETSRTTHNPRFTNRFKFVSRKPYLRSTTPKTVISNTTDQTLQSTNQQTFEGSPVVNTPETTEPVYKATSLQKATTKELPVPQAKPSRKRPQILRLTSQNPSRQSSYQPPPSTSEMPSVVTTSYSPFKNYGTASSRYTSNRKTVAITVPFLRGNYNYVTPTQLGGYSSSTPQTFTSDTFVPSVATAAPLVREVYHSSPQTISAQDFVSKYTPSVQTSTRSKYRYSTTGVPDVVFITPGQSLTARRIRPPSPPQAFDKVLSRVEPKAAFRPAADYDYYDSIEASVLGKIPEHSKVLLHSNGIIECLDQGNFPHPVSCKKFISCAKMDNDKIIGWEYTCPKNLSFDPIGGMCNWSAGLGCNEA